MKNNNKNNRIHEFNILYFNIQLVMTIITTIVFVLYLFNNNYKTLLQFCLSFTLFSVGINEFVIYHKRNMGWLMIGISLIILIFTILKMVGVM